MASAANDREKALDSALAQIERQFGKGSIMRLGEEGRAPMDVIPTGSITLDVALGIGGLPRGRIVEIYGPESSGNTPSRASRRRAVSLPSSMRSTRLTRTTPRGSASTLTAFMCRNLTQASRPLRSPTPSFALAP